MAIKDMERLVETLVAAMRAQAAAASTTKAEVDISGGIDSAVVAALSVLAFGKENVIVVKDDKPARPISVFTCGLHYCDS